MARADAEAVFEALRPGEREVVMLVVAPGVPAALVEAVAVPEPEIVLDAVAECVTGSEAEPDGEVVAAAVTGADAPKEGELEVSGEPAGDSDCDPVAESVTLGEPVADELTVFVPVTAELVDADALEVTDFDCTAADVVALTEGVPLKDAVASRVGDGNGV